jgi:small redox-active disulfide protein 2
MADGPLLVEILGPGCRRCDQATAEIRAVVERNGLEVEVRHVTDPVEIVSRGVLFDNPVVVVGGAVRSRGRVPSRGEIERWLLGGASA